MELSVPIINVWRWPSCGFCPAVVREGAGAGSALSLAVLAASGSALASAILPVVTSQYLRKHGGRPFLLSEA